MLYDLGTSYYYNNHCARLRSPTDFITSELFYVSNIVSTIESTGGLIDVTDRIYAIQSDAIIMTEFVVNC